MTEAVWVQIVTALGLVVVAVINKRDSRATRRELSAVATDVRVTRDHTENEHLDAPYPNMRDEITSVRETVEGMAQVQRGQDRRMERIERQTADLRDAGDATDDTLDRYQSRHARALADAVADRKRDMADLEARFERRVPELITAALEGHVAACPLRTPRT